MELNPDCVRDILLTVEEHSPWRYSQDGIVVERLQKYTHEELVYHIRQCAYSKLILSKRLENILGDMRIDDLSPDGHKFLSNVRQDTTWNRTKSIAGKIGAKSIDLLVQIASNVMTELIKSMTGSTP